MREALETLGAGWLADEVEALTEKIEHETPSDFNERVRYLPDSAGSVPGFIRFDLNPFMREILDCADPRSPVQEVNLKKGVQITYTTMLESILLYYIAHIKTRPCMMISADKELVKERIENYILPMLNQSDMGHLIRSSDEGNSRKTGKTANHLQWAGGGFLIPGGANNADKMRSWSIMLMLKDEIDAWPDVVGRDGDPDALTDARCDAFPDTKKIYRGGTPLTLPGSKIQYQYERGDQRKYLVLCRACSFPQELRWEAVDKETGAIGGFTWETDEGMLVLESVRYLCQNCGHEHYEHDKTRLFSEEHGAHWKPTVRPVKPTVRSYHLPALYSPFKPWHECVSQYLEGWDVEQRRARDVGKYQVFYNNILGEPFRVPGARVSFTAVSAHRRAAYLFGQVPNKHAVQYAGSPVLLLTCQVDVHKSNLAVSVMGWTRDLRCYVIDYWRFEPGEKDPDCTDLSSPVWARLRELIEETTYTADDGKVYRIGVTLVDAGYENSTVTDFCADYGAYVYPILGRERPGKNAQIKEFSPFETQAGTLGFKVLVDHYKDRLAPILRREWAEEAGPQKPYHFNAPLDTTDKQLKELTVEYRREETDERGNTVTKWYRPGNARNELWDLLVYGNAAVEIVAYQICIKHFELETVDWPRFWDFLETNQLFFN